MNSVVQLFEKTLPVFAMLCLGIICRRKNLLTREGVNALKNVAVNISLPAVMFSAFASAQYTANSICVPLVVFGLCLVALYLGHVLCRVMKIPGSLSPFLAAGFEAGMLGYALFAILFPDEAVSSFAMVDLGQVLFVFTVYKVLLARRTGRKGALKDAVSSPTVWAIAAGLLFGATGLYRALAPGGISGVIDAVCAFIAAHTSALILLAIGYDLTLAQIQWRKTASLISLRLGVSLLLLAAALLMNRFLLDGMMHTGALLLLFLLPPPFVLPVFADVEDERADISSALSALTVVSILLFTVLAVAY